MIIAAPILFIAFFYIIYSVGWIPVRFVRARMYLAHGQGASFTACTGSIRRVLRFRESRSYSFHLDGRVQQGSVTVRILSSGQPLLTLDAGSPDGVLTAQKGKRYTLQITFRNASGDYHLDWT